MVRIPPDLDLYRELEKDTIEHIRELSKSVALYHEILEETEDRDDRLTIEATIWDMRQSMEVLHEFAEKHRKQARRLEGIYRRRPRDHELRDGSAPEGGAERSIRPEK